MMFKYFHLPVAVLVALMCFPFTGLRGAVLLGLVAAIYLPLSERQKVASSIQTPIRSSGSFVKWPYISEVAFEGPLKRTIPLLLLLLAMVFPFFLNRYQVEILTLALIYVTLALGLNYIVGLCGLLALGYAAFYALGAYTYALLNTRSGVNFFLALPCAVIAGGAGGALVGLPVLRLRGDYLAIVTLGFGEIVRIVLNNWDSLTGGPNGILGIARPTLFGFRLGTPVGYYYMALSLAILSLVVQKRLIGSRIGLAWEAIREDEVAAAHLGIPVVKMKLLAMVLGGAWAGAAGALFASRMTHVSPESFTFLESVTILCMVVLGGMGSLTGVTLGALVLIILPELTRSAMEYRMLLFGLLLVLMMRFRPEGLIPSRRLRV